eukprot:scaffold5_cov331-Pavlova_lutheri.AAC.66
MGSVCAPPCGLACVAVWKWVMFFDAYPPNVQGDPIDGSLREVHWGSVLAHVRDTRPVGWMPGSDANELVFPTRVPLDGPVHHPSDIPSLSHVHVRSFARVGSIPPSTGPPTPDLPPLWQWVNLRVHRNRIRSTGTVAVDIGLVAWRHGDGNVASEEEGGGGKGAEDEEEGREGPGGEGKDRSPAAEASKERA